MTQLFITTVFASEHEFENLSSLCFEEAFNKVHGENY